MEPLSQIEWDTLRLAVKYSIENINSTGILFPGQILFHYYHRLSDHQCQELHKVMDEFLDSNAAFGNEQEDAIWRKFMNVLNREGHYLVQLMSDEFAVVFDSNGIYNVEQYVNRPHNEYPEIPKENIKVIVKNKTNA